MRWSLRQTEPLERSVSLGIRLRVQVAPLAPSVQHRFVGRDRLSCAVRYSANPMRWNLASRTNMPGSLNLGSSPSLIEVEM